jgi:hypothetical protein
MTTTPRWTPRCLVAVAVVAALANASCADRGAGACAAVVGYEEPVLTIDSAAGPDGRPVDTLALSRVRLDGQPIAGSLRDAVRSGRPWTPGTATTDADLHLGLAVAPDGSLSCRVPCGFGSNPGEITFTASAPGGLVATEHVSAEFDTRSSGCTVTFGGGTHVDLRLSRGSR